MPLPKPAQLLAAIIFIALMASAIHFLAGFDAKASAYGFTLKMPADFSAYPPNATPERDKTGAPMGQAIVLQNSDSAMVQIVVKATVTA